MESCGGAIGSLLLITTLLYLHMTTHGSLSVIGLLRRCLIGSIPGIIGCFPIFTAIPDYRLCGRHLRGSGDIRGGGNGHVVNVVVCLDGFGMFGSVRLLPPGMDVSRWIPLRAFSVWKWRVR